MPSVGDLQINVIANAAEFQAVMGQVKSTLVQVGATTQTTLGGQTATAAAQGSAAIGQLSSQTSNLASAFAKMSVLAGVFGLLGRASALFAEQEQLETRLRTAVENTGASFESQRGPIDEVAAAAARLGFRHADLIESFSLLVTQTGSVDEAIRRQAMAFDLARGTGMDLQTASRLLGKVTEDNTRVLQRYGIMIRQGASEQEFFAAVQAKVGGQAEKQINDTAVAGQRLMNVMRGMAESVGGFFATNLQPIALLAIAFDSLGIRGVLAAGGVGALGHEMRNVFTAAGGLLAALAPIGIALGVMAAGVAVAVGAMRLLSAIPGLGFFGEELDQIGTIISKIGVGGFVSELTGIGKEAPPAATATHAVADAMQKLGGAYEGVMTKMAASTVPAAALFGQISKAMSDLGAAGSAVQAKLNDVRDILFGTKGMTAEQAMRAFGVQQLDSIQKTMDAETGKLQNERDSALREQQAVAQFWEDEAARRQDFMERMAEKTKPVIETIDQLNKDLGPGFDQRRRALQAQATKARLDAEITDMQRKEDERRARLRPPATPTLDKLAREGKTIESLEADIAASKAKYEEAMADVRSIIDDAVKQLADSLDTLRGVIRNKRMIQGEPVTPETAAEAAAFLAAHPELPGGGGGLKGLGFAAGRAVAEGVGGWLDQFNATIKEKFGILKPPESLSDAVVDAMIVAMTTVIGGAQTKVRQGGGGGGTRLS